MRVALSRANCDFRPTPVFGLANAYPCADGIDGTPTVRACSVRGISRFVDHAVSGSTGDGSVSR